jgi:hypothetical protein
MPSTGWRGTRDIPTREAAREFLGCGLLDWAATQRSHSSEKDRVAWLMQPRLVRRLGPCGNGSGGKKHGAGNRLEKIDFSRLQNAPVSHRFHSPQRFTTS